MAKLVDLQLRCLRCGYVWIPRIEPILIKACPACKSRKWQLKKGRR